MYVNMYFYRKAPDVYQKTPARLSHDEADGLHMVQLRTDYAYDVFLFFWN